MKRILYAIIALMLCFTATLSIATANPIDTARAKAVAANFYSSVSQQPLRGTQPAIAYQATYTATPATRHAHAQEVTCFYVMNMGSEGYVIVSADDCALPVLAYSTEGAFNPDAVPAGLHDILEGYRHEIGSAISQQHPATAEVSAQWAAIDQPQRSTRTVVVDPIIQTTWNQYPYYNSMCPVYQYSGYTVQAVTGCVATATAQLFRYWEWPVRGNGSHSYQAISMDSNPVDLGTLSADFGNTIYLYDLMPTSIDAGTHSLMRTQVARLSYHCGVAVDMSYGYNGSGAFSSDLPYAFANYFDYSCDGILYLSQYSVNQWNNILKANLDQGLPLSYSGSSSEGGHAFLCDGYDNTNYFHFNFGWGGSGDGFFTVSGTGVHEYTSYQAAIFGIRPNKPVCDGESCTITIEVSNNTSNGNGWNGGYMVVYQGDKAIKGITLLPTLHSNTYTFGVCEDSLHFEWYPGSNDAVCRILIRNADNDTLHYVDGNPTPGRFFSVNYACSECPYPINLTISDIDEEEATLSWSSGGTPIGYNLEYGPAGFTPGTGTLLTDVQSPYTFENLTAEHPYDVYVQAVCGEDTLSGWSSVASFSTRIRCNDDNNRTVTSTVGNSGTYYFPIDLSSSSYLYSYSQQLFSRSELNALGITAAAKINSVSFQSYQLANQTINNISIYVGHAQIDTFVYTYIPVNEMTLVYSGPIQLHSGNMTWNEITFQNPFFYDGTSSLVVAVLNNSGTAVTTSGSQGCFVCHSATGRKCLITESSTALNAATLSTPDYYVPGTRNNMKFNICIAGYACDDVALTLDTAVCEDDFPFTWHGVTFDDEGTEIVTITFGGGCDSVITMNVTKKFHSTFEFSAEACGEYAWNDEIYDESGDYTQTLIAANGCDSIVTLHLTIHPVYTRTETLNLCRTELPYTYEAENVTFDEEAVSDEFYFPHATMEGCDSSLTLIVNIGEPIAPVVELSHCGPYTWNDSTYSESGTYTQTFTTSCHCDSVVTLILTVLQPTEGELTDEACGSYSYEGQTFTTSGDHTVTLTNAAGCDSVVTLHLTIHPVPDVTITGNTQITVGSNTTLTASGADSYEWSTGETTADITVSPTSNTTYSVTGTTEHGCTGTASTTVQVNTAVSDYDNASGILLFPNPATHTVTLQADGNGATMKEAAVYDATGRVVFRSNAEVNKMEINVSDWESGIYFARIISGDSVVVKKFTKQ